MRFEVWLRDALSTYSHNKSVEGTRLPLADFVWLVTLVSGGGASVASGRAPHAFRSADYPTSVAHYELATW